MIKVNIFADGEEGGEAMQTRDITLDDVAFVVWRLEKIKQKLLNLKVEPEFSIKGNPEDEED